MLAHKIVATRSSTDKPLSLNLYPKYIEKQRDVGLLKMDYHFSGITEILKTTKCIFCKKGLWIPLPLFFANMVVVSKTIFIVAVILIISADFPQTNMQTLLQ